MEVSAVEHLYEFRRVSKVGLDVNLINEPFEFHAFLRLPSLMRNFKW